MTINNCCERVKFFSDLLTQSRDLGLSDTYQLELERILLEFMNYISNDDETSIITCYDTNITNILAMRDVEFTDWMNKYKNKYSPYEEPA